MRWADLRGVLDQAAALAYGAAAAVTLVPLRALYFMGPAWHGYGFWAGKAPADMCAQLTGMPATDFLGDPPAAARCAARLEREYMAFQTGVLAVAYVWALYCAASVLWWRVAVVRPMAAEVRHVAAEVRRMLLLTAAADDDADHASIVRPRLVLRYVADDAASPKFARHAR